STGLQLPAAWLAQFEDREIQVLLKNGGGLCEAIYHRPFCESPARAGKNHLKSQQLSSLRRELGKRLRWRSFTRYCDPSHNHASHAKSLPGRRVPTSVLRRERRRRRSES